MRPNRDAPRLAGRGDPSPRGCPSHAPGPRAGGRASPRRGGGGRGLHCTCVVVSRLQQDKPDVDFGLSFSFNAIKKYTTVLYLTLYPARAHVAHTRRGVVIVRCLLDRTVDRVK